MYSIRRYEDTAERERIHTPPSLGEKPASSSCISSSASAQCNRIILLARVKFFILFTFYILHMWKNLLLSEKYKLPDCDHDVSIPNGIRQTQFEMENQIAITSPTISSGLSPTEII